MRRRRRPGGGRMMRLLVVALLLLHQLIPAAAPAATSRRNDDDDGSSGVSVSSKDGLRFDFAGTSVSGVSIGGTSLGPPDTKFTGGFEVAEFMDPASSPKGLGPELLGGGAYFGTPSYVSTQQGAKCSRTLHGSC